MQIRTKLYKQSIQMVGDTGFEFTSHGWPVAFPIHRDALTKQKQ